VLTDLDAQSTARALRSLGAELTRREEILAAHRAVDIADLPDDVSLARLVIVVDEFASLADELPSFVPDLVGIAQRGRSLGVHLVLATQRPSGVVSPEIRANCSLRLCLRTADEGDSRDVLGTAEAAHVPLDLPGRGFARLGSGPPTAVQVARVSAPAGPAPTEPRVRRWRWPDPGASASRADDGATDLDELCRRLAGLARDQRIGPAHRPWLPPLPANLSADDLDGLPLPPTDEADSSPVRRLRLGVVDRPDALR
jgi:S-DNA-T family DNA segregation ATPase FtsK/SpoIIIE